MAAVGVNDLCHPVNRRDHHALFDVRLVVAFGDELDDIGVLRQLLAYVLDDLVDVDARLVFGSKVGVVTTRIEAALHQIEQVPENENPRPQILRLVEVPVEEGAVTLDGVVVDVRDEEEVVGGSPLGEVDIDGVHRPALAL